MLHVVADRIRWQTALAEARRRAAMPPDGDLPATGRAADDPTERTAPLLSVEAVAERLDTKPRFVRRLIAERRIEFHKVGRHVRISEPALAEFIAAGRVDPAGCSHRRSA